MNFDRMADSYDEWYQMPMGKYADKLEKELVLKFAQPNNRGKVLDVGCGTGNYALEFSRLGFETVCLDISENMLKVAKGKGCGKLILGDAQRLPFGEDSFGLAVAVTTIEFLNNSAGAAEEMKRVVRPQGKVILGVLNKWSLWALERRLTKDETYEGAKFYNIFELRKLGVRRWSSTLFVPKPTPKSLLNHLPKGFSARLLKPFGAFLAGEILVAERS